VTLIAIIAAVQRDLNGHPARIFVKDKLRADIKYSA
jgi:hypothetical protein